MKKLVAWAVAAVVVTGLFLVGTTVTAGAEDGVDGCTAVPDSGPGFDFTESCNQHDRCYLQRPYGDDRAARKQCDVEFYHDMVDSCRQDNEGFWARRGCYGLAGVYYLGVRAFGGFGWAERNTADVTNPAA